MASTSVTECAHCGAAATLQCAGCRDAPEYQPGDAGGVHYCGRDCQISHWPSHKSRCINLRRRRKLLRTALILKAALLTYREMVYDIPLTKIERRDGTLYLHQRPRAPTTVFQPGPFPDHLTTHVEHREAALTVNQCTLAMALLGPLTRKLLAGIASTLEVLDLQLGRRPMPARLIPGPDPSSCPHTVIQVSRSGAGETWILDLTGCQYGFRDVLVPYDRYLADRACPSLQRPVPYDATETKDLDYFATLPFLTHTRAQRENLNRERQSRLRFAEFVNTRVRAEVLEGSTVEFQQKREAFTSMLKRHLEKPPGGN
ncbi:zinc finger MYND domain-containing protein [Aspergillus ibericus CBS 121593]|uniref:MYND-type domain-containing protein n=1 Tax=Aspergillus ibericus CBS 121593 TaxID=1448316 RepID=A0A395H910_9EURO|nr:hypothetical protein BO80DRAFT_350362 [Aspergillus ibericus CBS 121593]RAL03368.1 hypothetical protein BO80DRAFT_350362 [Aspergillus ibericus CBS 121593]